MGAFYTNITLHTTQQANVVEALRAAKREAYVSQPMNGCTVVYDRESEDQDIDVLNKVASTLSAKLRCAALAILVHDDDVLVYTLHENGELTDEYISWPAYFDDSGGGSESPEGGDAETLARAFGADGNVDKVESALRVQRAGNTDDGFVFETERHEELAIALGLPALAVGAGYQYIEQGELPEGATEQSFTRVA